MEDGRVSPTATHTPAPIPTATPAPTPTASEPSPKGISQTVQHLAPQALRHAILHTLDKPVVFRGYLAPCDTGWHCLEWPLEKWAEIFGDQKLKLRVGQRIGTGTKLEAPQWEGECQHASMTLSAFLAWAQGHTTTTTTCGTQVGTNMGWHWHLAFSEVFQSTDVSFVTTDWHWHSLGLL